MNTQIGIGIKKARKNKNLSIIELAAILKVEPSVINGWESGFAFPSLVTLKEIKTLLGVSTDMLLLAEERTPLDISSLDEEQRHVVIDLYKKIKPM